ncbi:unnamed protein product [Ambrosiozyma monospora]|uniref:Unnamed protein product n=1 Tax=Ambrosiozyma monospora TaxID=43982 RepID=A0ACB5UAY1_AMBMO|nr:unnamed protein product [Ambrosiozyma monospora]
MSQVQDFYQKGYKVVRDSTNYPVIIHDAFQADHYFDNVLNDGYSDVVVDHHHYQVFSTGELQRSVQDRITTACGWGWSEGSEYHWNVVGEFSGALTDCAKWLNGVGRGARYDNTYQG